jgi:transposase
LPKAHAEPNRGRRKWEGDEYGRDVTYANRRRINGLRGRQLMRRRGELIERSFAHNLETGGMRRVHLRKHDNILKRVLVHVAAFNLGLVMRALFGVGKPRVLQGRRDLVRALARALRAFWCAILALLGLTMRMCVSMPSLVASFRGETTSLWPERTAA